MLVFACIGYLIILKFLTQLYLVLHEGTDAGKVGASLESASNSPLY